MGKGLVYLLFLMAHTVTDVKEKRIYVAVLALQALVGMAFQICGKQAGIITVLSCLPGLLCLGIGRLSREKVGYGDGWMIFVGGLYLSPGQMMTQLLWASMAACIYTIWSLAVGKLTRKEEIPFAPFLLAGYLGGVMHGRR